MPNYRLQIRDGHSGETAIDAPNAHEALNSALNAMAQFACRNFPPPENVSITVTEADGAPVAILNLAFSIDYAERVREVLS
jgi:hypothetical protein